MSAELRTAVGLLVRQQMAAKAIGSVTLAASAGLSRATLQRVLAGTGDVRLGTLANLADALGVDLRDLVPGPREVTE